MTPLDAVLSRLEGVKKQPSGFIALCPAHEDRSPSLSIKEGEGGKVLLNCFAGCETAAVCAAVGLVLADLFPEDLGDRRGATVPFTPAMAAETWASALQRALDDDCADDDQPVYRYLEARGLAPCWEQPRFGVLSPGMDLTPAVQWWPTAGYRIALPLFDLRGRLVNVQARSIAAGCERKVLFPAGSRAKGCAFANAAALRVLQGVAGPDDLVFVGEGLTDWLALACCLASPVLSAPGTEFAKHLAGPWACGRRVVVALDCDGPGRAASEALCSLLYGAGAVEVFQAEWPEGCTDACEVVARSGLGGLEDFLRSHLQEVLAT